MALAVDSSTPAFKRQTGTAGGTTIVSASFSPPANSLLAIFIGITASSLCDVTGISDSLASHLTYTKVADAVEGTNHAWAEVWLAQVGASAPGAMTVTATFALQPNFNDTMGIVVFTGAAATQNGATATSTATSGAPGLPSGSVTTTQPNSWVFSVVTNFTNTTLPTIPAGQTDVFNSITFASGVSGDACWVQAQSATTPSSGTNVTVNDTAPSIEYAMATVEILADPGGGAPFISFPHLPFFP